MSLITIVKSNTHCIFLAQMWGDHAKHYHVPGLCLLDIGRAPYIFVKLWLRHHSFTCLTSVNYQKVLLHIASYNATIRPDFSPS